MTATQTPQRLAAHRWLGRVGVVLLALLAGCTDHYTKPDFDEAVARRDAYECERDTAIAPILLTSLIRPTVPPAVGTSGMNRRTFIVVLARSVIFSGPLRGPTPGGSR